jgi:glycosyltransferase involved in cell wall biosynthesis
LVTRVRVALDARRLQDQPQGGVGRALANVVELIGSEVEFTLLTDARRSPVATELRQQPVRPPPGAPETIWLQWNVARWLRDFDGIFHGTFYALPVRLPVPGIVTIYDLSFEVHSEDFGRAKRWLFQQQARSAATRARQVVTATTHAKDELVRHYHVDPERIVISPLAVDRMFAPSNAERFPTMAQRLGVRNPYIVALGGARRRGLEVAIGAWRRLRRSGLAVDLVVVGPSTVAPEPGLVRAGVLGDPDWATVLAGASAFCYPTRYEGFGLPALESAASGTPVVCAPVGPLPEVLGDAAEWCATPTEQAIATGLHRVVADPAHAASLRDRGLHRISKWPTWEDSANVLLRAYRGVAHG